MRKAIQTSLLAAALSLVVLGCGPSGNSSDMADNSQIRKENPNDSRPVSGDDAVSGKPLTQ